MSELIAVVQLLQNLLHKFPEAKVIHEVKSSLRMCIHLSIPAVCCTGEQPSPRCAQSVALVHDKQKTAFGCVAATLSLYSQT